MDTHDADALAHYEALIAQRYPPQLAAQLAAARYQAKLMKPASPPQPPVAALPLIRETLVAVQEQHPDLKRDVGRTVAAIDRKGNSRRARG